MAELTIGRCCLYGREHDDSVTSVQMLARNTLETLALSSGIFCLDFRTQHLTFARTNLTCTTEKVSFTFFL